LRHPQAQSLQAAYDAIGLTQVRVQTGDANLIAVLATPKGQVRLESALSPS
jgi:hypothetical protein